MQMFWKRKSISFYDQHVEMLKGRISRFSEIIETAKRNSGEGSLLVIQNYARHIKLCSEISLVLWRNGEDPREYILKIDATYKEMSFLRASYDPDHKYRMSEITENLDWNIPHTLLWLAELDVPREFYNSPFDIEVGNYSQEFYPGQALEIMVESQLFDLPKNDVAEEIGKNFLSESTGLYSRTCKTYLDLLSSMGSNKKIVELIKLAEENWLCRKNAEGYKDGPFIYGKDHFNELSLDYTLGAILKKIGSTGSSTHCWLWN